MAFTKKQREEHAASPELAQFHKMLAHLHNNALAYINSAKSAEEAKQLVANATEIAFKAAADFSPKCGKDCYWDSTLNCCVCGGSA